METYKYTLWTEWKPSLKYLVDKFFDCYTLMRCVGVWNGAEEEAAQVVLFAELNAEPVVRDLVAEIKEWNEQTEVLLTIERVELEVL